jgi:hypothetical protein
MADVNEIFAGQSLKAADLGDAEPTVVIASATVREFEKDGKTTRKIELKFSGKQKSLICNKTNAMRIASAFGTNTDGWIGKKIQLYVDQVEFMGDIMDGVRVRPVKDAAKHVDIEDTF